MTMNANSSLATYGQLPWSLACAELVEGLYADVNEFAYRWHKSSGGVVGDVVVDDFSTSEGSYRIEVTYMGFKVYFSDLGAAGEWLERMESVRYSPDSGEGDRG